MEFFFPADVFTAYPRQARTERRSCAAGPSANVFSGCGFDSHPFFADNFADAIQHERAAYARAQAQRAARAEAARRAKAAAIAAARREAEERQARAYLEHVLEMQQREAQRRYHLEQLQRQRQHQEALRRQQYQEYQRRKAYAIEKERQRIAAARAAEAESKQLFLALEDLLIGGLNSFYHAFQNSDDEDMELAHKNDASPRASAAPVDTKGKGKAAEQAIVDNHSMDIDHANNNEDTAAAAAAALKDEDDADPEEVGPAPASTPVETTTSAPPAAPASVTKTEQLVFSHAFPSDSSLDKTSIRADQINISVDESTRKVTVSGLWNNEPAGKDVQPASPARAGSPTPSDSSSRRGRSRSPKRARVSDVDENGDEIVTPDTNETDDDFVEVNFTRASSATVADDSAAAAAKVDKTFDLPHGANVDGLRAELSDEGLKLFTTVSA